MSDKSYNQPQSSSDLLVSVIVATKNEEQHIENCLLSISEQTHPQIETIVVDNYSTDKTQEIALRHTDKVFEKGPERSVQRNYGMIEKAQGKYVMFLDADMILGPKVIEECVSFIKKGEWLALHIPEFVLGKSYWSQVRRFERTFYNGTVIDGARFFKKSAFVKVKGFDETLSGPEDWDIDKKIKKIGRIGLLPSISEYNEKKIWELSDFILEKGGALKNEWSIIYHNESKFILKKYVSKKGYYSKSLDNYIAKWGRKDPDIHKQLGIRYRFFDVFFENSKWKRFFMRPHLVLGVYFLRLLTGCMFLFRNSNE